MTGKKSKKVKSKKVRNATKSAKVKNEAKRTLERARNFRYALILEGVAVGI